MKGDFSRDSFNPARRYTGVRQQQGRVQLDADWNEMVDIVRYLRERSARDVVGPSGVPEGMAGFAITVADEERKVQAGLDFCIGKGHMYVNGTLCENEVDVTFRTQPDYPNPDVPESPTGRYLVYLDVWQRHITAVEDPAIVEDALGGVDTATRTKTVWQVKLLPINDDGQSPESLLLDRAAPGKLKARVTDSGKYVLENLLYRVEVHDVSENGEITFKWSRENGSVNFPILRWRPEAPSALEEILRELAVKSEDASENGTSDAQSGGQTGANGDANKGGAHIAQAAQLIVLNVDGLTIDPSRLQNDDYVEIVSDTLTLRGETWPMLRVRATDGQTGAVQCEPPAGFPLPLPPLNLDDHPYLRRWDREFDPTGGNSQQRNIVPGEWDGLERDIRNEFRKIRDTVEQEKHAIVATFRSALQAFADDLRVKRGGSPRPGWQPIFEKYIVCMDSWATLPGDMKKAFSTLLADKLTQFWSADEASELETSVDSVSLNELLNDMRERLDQWANESIQEQERVQSESQKWIDCFWSYRVAADSVTEGEAGPSADMNNAACFNGILLENSLEVAFTMGTYRPGDYWLIPMRQRLANIEWPALVDWPLAGHFQNESQPLAPFGPEHATVPLATLIMVDGRLSAGDIEDLRSEFETATDATTRVRDLGRQARKLNADLDALRNRVARLTASNGVYQEYMADDLTMDKETAAGTVVAFDPDGSGRIVMATRDNGMRLIGVVADAEQAPDVHDDDLGDLLKPYLVLQYGQIACRVVGPVTAGDILVVGNRRGCAARAGIYMRPGTIIGKALESTVLAGENDVSTIEVLVTLG